MFSVLSLHCFLYAVQAVPVVLPVQDVRVFRLARVYFSIGGQHFLSPPVEFRYIRDSLIEYARPVIIRLHHHLARYVKLQLYFDSKWMMISDIEFTSEPAAGNFSAEVLPPPPTQPDTNIKVIEVQPATKANASLTTGTPHTYMFYSQDFAFNTASI
jgi:discoidin domain receptor family protein 2